MKTDSRLKALAENVTGKGIVCDIGTDHAYLVVYLVREKICEKAIAADINDGPLLAAKATLMKYKVTEDVKVIKSDGLDNIKGNGVSDVVIAGMGAELITEILRRCEWIKHNVNLVLQPMTHVPVLRKWLYENGFRIIKETAVSDEKFCYTVIRAEYCGIAKVSTFSFCECGKITADYKDGRKYLENQLVKLQKIKEGLTKNMSYNIERINDIESAVEEIKKRLEGK